VKIAKSEIEHSKVSIRTARKDANNELKKTEISDDLKNNVEIDIQKLTDQFIAKVDVIYIAKEKEIMTV
jgi:ribosome recycling factor